MRKLVLSIVLAASFTGIAQAGPTCTFDFDAAAYLSGPAAIETYMEGIYGSDITVETAIVGNGIVPGVLHNYDGDHYLQSNPLGGHWFKIHFNEAPIVAASFDWGVELDGFHAEADGQEVFSAGWGAWSSGNSGVINFAAPVTTLYFHNSFLGEVQIDNLCVESAVVPVPAPGAVLLGSIGLGFVGWLRRRRIV